MNARLDRLRAMRDWIDEEIRAELRLLAAPLGSESLIQRASDLYGVAPADILAGQSRDPQVVKARQAACWLLRNAGMTFHQIGDLLGYADHTTAMYAVRKIDGNPSVKALLSGLEAVA